MGVQPVIILAQQFGEIGKPKGGQHQEKEDNKIQVTFLIEGPF
jgi:hypothetical protein